MQRKLYTMIPSQNFKLGCIYNEKSKKAKFSLWAPTSSSVQVRLFPDYKNEKCDFSFDLDFDSATGVWSKEIQFEKSVEKWFYEYKVKNEKGEKICLDPYSFSLSIDKNDGSLPKSAIVDQNFLARDEFPNISKKSECKTQNFHPVDSIIYEISVRDASISPDSPEVDATKKGTFAGFESVLPYIKELGVTHIQLLPVLKFCNTDESNRAYENSNLTHSNNYNWGYDPENYFSLSAWYSLDGENPYARISEFKHLVKMAHSYGLKVILDVVYNHMSKIDFLDDIVPNYYFRLNKDSSLKSNSGCGNDIASENFMARKLITDSLLFLMTTYDVDGFRFDLMGLLDAKTVLGAYEKCRKIKNDVLFIGEGWKMYNGRAGTKGMDQKMMFYTDKVAVFNDEFRDLAKGGGMCETQKAFLTGGNVNIVDLFCNICGKPVKNYSAKSPNCNVMYLSCHDGLTLHDSLCVNLKIKGFSKDALQFAAERQILANTLLLTSQGIIFLHAGQEKCRSKNAFQNKTEVVENFVRNSYKSSDSINQINWVLAEYEKKVLDYTKKLIALRKKYSAFRIPSNKEIMDRIFLLGEFCSDFVLVYKILDTGGDWYLCFNASFVEQKIPLLFPQHFSLYADKNDIYIEGKPFLRDQVVLPASSALILRYS